MQFIRPIAALLFYLSRGMAILYLLLAAFILVVLALKSGFPEAGWLPIEVYDLVGGERPQSRFDIFIPLTKAPFILGRYTIWGMIEVVGGIGLYGTFFYLLSRIFDSFRAERLFTAQAIKNLMAFSQANFILPPLFLLFLNFHPDYKVDMGEVLITGLHLLLATFSLFQAAIFKEGFSLQQEQDLTI